MRRLPAVPVSSGDPQTVCRLDVARLPSTFFGERCCSAANFVKSAFIEMASGNFSTAGISSTNNPDAMQHDVTRMVIQALSSGR